MQPLRQTRISPVQVLGTSRRTAPVEGCKQYGLRLHCGRGWLHGHLFDPARQLEVPSNLRTCHTYDPSVRPSRIGCRICKIRSTAKTRTTGITALVLSTLVGWIFSCLTRSSIALTGALVSAGRGKVTIDSGAAETVMLRNMLQHETLVEGAPKKAGVKYVAANGG